MAQALVAGGIGLRGRQFRKTIKMKTPARQATLTKSCKVTCLAIAQTHVVCLLIHSITS